MENDLFKKNRRKMETLNLYFFRYMKIRLENDLFNHFKIDLIRWIWCNVFWHNYESTMQKKEMLHF